jgi:putative ABC transport system permease protein
MRALDRKLVRDLWHLRGQMLSIALVVATGIMSVITMRGGYESLADAQATYYRDARFPDLWASLERAPTAVESQLLAIPGVAAVETRVTLFGRLDLPDLAVPGMGRFISLPDQGVPALSDIVLRSGRRPVATARDEVVASQNFALARGLRVGDAVDVILNGRARRLRIVGTAISPEHSYAVPPGGLYPDDERYGVFWIARGVLGPANDMEGAFNEVVLSRSPGANTAALSAEVDRILEPYGGLGAYGREDQFSHQTLQAELDQNRTMGTAIPAIFLAVAAFLLNLVLGRLIATQRSEIGVLKAFGYRDREVATHFLGLALAAVGAGALLGIGSGVWLGDAYVALYGAYFDFPTLDYHLSLPLLAISSGISVLAATAGALGAARSAARLPPAEAMRPEPPPSFKPGPFERLGLADVLPSAGRMILRNMERRPIRVLLSSLGVAFSTAILVLGMFMFDGVDFMMVQQFEVIQREDLQVSFNQKLPVAVGHELERLTGVTRVEPYRVEAARLRSGHREREVGLQGLDPEGRLRRIVSGDGSIRPIPSEGVVLSAVLAERLGVEAGDSLGVEFLEGRRAEGSLAVAGVVEDFLGLSAIMSIPALAKTAGGPRVYSGAFLSVDADTRAALLRDIEAMPAVASVVSPRTLLESFRSQLDESLLIAVAFLLGFASIISVAVIYNGARIALSERGRELASLRVMGFRRREVSVLLLGEQGIITLLAIPVGWLLGVVMAARVVAAIENDTYRIPFVVSSQTYLISAVVTVLAALVSAWIVRRRIDHMDLISVLKTRE